MEDRQIEAEREPEQTVEAAITALAERGGATIEQLATEPGRPLLDLARTPPLWPRAVQAAAIRSVIAEVVEGLGDTRSRDRVREQLGLARNVPRRAQVPKALRAVVRRAGNREPGFSAGKSEYAALARMVAARLSQLNTSSDWAAYAKGYVPYDDEPTLPPFSFDNCHMLFRLSGRVGIECITFRTLRATAEGVRSYRAVGWYYSDPSANCEIVPLANCKLGRVERLDRGGIAAELLLPHSLTVGETCFLASKVVFNSQEESARNVSHEVRSQGVEQLTVAVQFDTEQPPARVWRYTSARDEIGMKPPPIESSGYVPVSELGYAAHVFRGCRSSVRYGLQWDWS